MAILNIRNLPEETHMALRLRAARAKRSMEAEARDIICRACGTASPPSFTVAGLQDFVRDLYDGCLPSRTVDDLIAERRAEAERE